MLMDMEELLGRISNRAMVGYMREASTCYAAGAYRGCIVLSYIALFDDLRAKLDQLAKVSKTAQKVHKEVEKRAGDQDVFETFMADQLKKEGFLTAAEHKQLDIVRQIRNRAAHPSGVIAKAEEARYVYRVVIEDFLSQPLLKTAQAIDALAERLEGSNFFPTTQIADITDIARSALEGMHTEAYGALLARLVDLVKGAVEQSRKNAERMLIGLAGLGDPALTALIRSIAVIRLSHDGDQAKMLGRLVGADAGLLSGLKDDDVIRVRALLEANVDATSPPGETKLSHPAKQLAAMVKMLGEDAVLDDYGAFADKVVSRHPYNENLIEAAKASAKLGAKLVAIWKMRAKSSQFTTANTFADALPVLDDAADLLTGADALHIVAGVVEAADIGAHRAKSVRRTRFAEAPAIRQLAIDHIGAKPKAAAGIIDKHLPGTDAKTFISDELVDDGQ